MSWPKGTVMVVGVCPSGHWENPPARYCPRCGGTMDVRSIPWEDGMRLLWEHGERAEATGQEGRG